MEDPYPLTKKGLSSIGFRAKTIGRGEFDISADANNIPSNDTSFEISNEFI